MKTRTETVAGFVADALNPKTRMEQVEITFQQLEANPLATQEDLDGANARRYVAQLQANPVFEHPLSLLEGIRDSSLHK